MFTHKDIEYRTIFFINCIQDRNLRVSNGELLLEEISEKKTLTKLPFQKILAIFVVGHISITTPLIEKCQKNNVALVVMRQNLRPVFYWSNSAEANYLLRQKQYEYAKDNLLIARVLVKNKIKNQLTLLNKTKQKNELVESAKQYCESILPTISTISDYNQLMGTEGIAAKKFFEAYYQQYDWKSRMPRTKVDVLNATLDIGYTILFNYIECFVRMFGFDVYVGVYHRLWFKRKSLICDLVEPFRCVIDNTVRNAFAKKQFKKTDFTLIKNEYRLKYEKNGDYCRVFFDALVPYKMEIFKYIQNYYRCFMQGKLENEYPQFIY